MRPTLLKLHRWIALAFALPLLVVILTGVVLSIEPWLVTRAIEPGSIAAADLQALLRTHDPDGKARAISFRSYDRTLSIGAGRGGAVVVDVATSRRLAGPSTIARVLGTARGLHERLLVDAAWLTISSTAAMLVVILIGVLMGWPRFANSLAGWHKGIAWSLLPLIVLSPLTALLMAAGVTFAEPPAATREARQAPATLAEAIGIVAREHDLAALVWIRAQGTRTLARVVTDGEYAVYVVARDGMERTPRNWPRLWHEGNFAGGWSAAMNLVVSLACATLLATGFAMWLRRRAERARLAARLRPAD